VLRLTLYSCRESFGSHCAGVTNYASGLIYQYQSGGLNEGFSDIVGATMEFYINDKRDEPDFDLGENVVKADGLKGSILRYMEEPSKDGKSIGSVCDYTNEMSVHHTSGVPNKAFVRSVRACEASACSTSLRECVLLLGPMFMYANIHRMTSLDGYEEAAAATCFTVPEYIQAKSPNTTCTAVQVKNFIRNGWNSVGLAVDADTCAVTSPKCAIPDMPDGDTSDVGFCRQIIEWMISAAGWLGKLFN
jgi:Zn-dependent metalloprotease